MSKVDISDVDGLNALDDGIYSLGEALMHLRNYARVSDIQEHVSVLQKTCDALYDEIGERKRELRGCNDGFLYHLEHGIDDVG